MTRAFLRGFRALGLSVDEICHRVGVDPEAVMDAATRVPGSILWSLWEEAARQSGDLAFGLRVGRAIPLAGSAGVVGAASAMSETGLEAVRRFARFSQLAADLLSVELRDGASDVSIAFHIVNEAEHVGIVDQAYDAILAVSQRNLNATIEGGATPIRVSLQRSSAARLEAYEQCFGCPITHPADRYALHFSRESLERPMLAADHHTVRRLEEQLSRELDALAPALTKVVGANVRIGIERQERPTQESIARHLGIGLRTLQRRLREEGSSFRTILERERQVLALDLLSDPTRRVVDVAHTLGFEDSTSFSKAFRRWTGHSPRAYRTQAAVAGQRASSDLPNPRI